MGRPPVPAEKRRTTLIKVLLTAAEYEELRRAAAAASMSLSTWMRVAALEKARRRDPAKERRIRLALIKSSGLDGALVAARLRRGWTLERAVGTPVRRGDMESGLRAAEAELRRRI
jgi:hypothetical protein